MSSNKFLNSTRENNLVWNVAFYNLKNMLNYILIYLQMAWRNDEESLLCVYAVASNESALFIFELLSELYYFVLEM